MALKGDRSVLDNRVDIFVDETAIRGGVLSYSTAGSGAALDQASNLGTYAANGSGKVPIGFLMEDMVNIDQTLYKVNQHKHEVQKGGKPWIVNKGWVLTNFFYGTSAVGPVYLGMSGNLTFTNVGTVQTPLVGRCESTADEDGYIKVSINL